MGARFTERAPVHEPVEGCRIDHPVLLESLAEDVDLVPPALLNCRMAAASARFLRDVVSPAADRHFDSSPRTVVQSSAYVCRSRHDTDIPSEHALGNALDWGAIRLDDGETIEVREHDEDETLRQGFLEELRDAACGPFTTVLGPGTDAAHEDHFHFDLADRRNGPFCR